MPRGGTPLPLRVRVLEPGERATAADLWQEVEEAHGEAPLAVSWRWTETWLRHYGESVEHRFLVLHDAAAPVAAALVTCDRILARRVSLRRAHVGTAGEPEGASVVVERNALLALPHAREAAAATLAGWLRAAGRHDELVLEGFVPEDAELLARHEPGLELERRASPVTALAAGEDVLGTLRSGPRRRVRQSLRAFGELQAEWVEDPARAPAVMGELIALHQARWRAAGERGAFADCRFRAFHRAAVARLLPGGEAILFRVTTAGGATVGCLLSYVDRGRVLFYQSGLGAFEHSAQRPGLAVHALCMQACADRGLHTYDFLAGESRYKRELATGEDELVWASAPRGTPRGRVLRAVRRHRREPGPPAE